MMPGEHTHQMWAFATIPHFRYQILNSGCPANLESPEKYTCTCHQNRYGRIRNKDQKTGGREFCFSLDPECPKKIVWGVDGWILRVGFLFFFLSLPSKI